MKKRPAVGVAAIVIKDGKALLGKRKGVHGSGTWAFPGGHLEFNESIEACAKREVLEETGMSVKNVRFAALTNDLFHQNDKHYVTLFVVCDHEKGTPEIKEPDKCEVWDWFFWNEFPNPKFLSLQNLLEQGFIPVGIKNASSPEKLHQMTAAQVVSFFVSDGCEKKIEEHSHAELMEAAFMFENQLMELLDDINPTFFESYAALSPLQLSNIIKSCAGQICRIETGE